jgi:DNA-binding LytR/AlgR family response regulator
MGSLRPRSAAPFRRADERNGVTPLRISSKKALTPDEKRQALAYLQEPRVILRQARMLMRLSSSVYYKAKTRPEDALTQDKLTELAEETTSSHNFRIRCRKSYYVMKQRIAHLWKIMNYYKL